MNIFLDARFYRRSGIGRYIEELYKGILNCKPNTNIIVGGSDDIDISNKSFLKLQEIIPYNSPIYSLNEQIEGSLLVRKLNKRVDVFHIPYFNAPWFLPKNSVVTIHDLTQFLFPKFFGRFKRFAAEVVLRNALNKAGRVVVVSESTKKDLVNYYPEFEGKVKVIYNGISSDFKPQPENEVNAFKKSKGISDYILYVGNRKPTKNIKRLLEAFSIIGKEHRFLQLIIIGEKFSKVDEVDIWRRKLNLSKSALKESVKISDEELRSYYCGAKVLIHPSLYEGFGFSPLEAMACGCPVVASNIASLPEICGDAAYYVDPYSIESIAEGIDKILIDSNLRQTLVQKGLERAKLFSWEKSARKHIKVFEEVLSV